MLTSTTFERGARTDIAAACGRGGDAMSLGTRLRTAAAFLWATDRPLAAVGALMTAAAVLSVAGLVTDPRAIAGFPAWLKPLKFAVSTGIYCLTLAWVFSYLPDWPKTRRWVSLVTSAVIVFEVAVIDFQAWRGTTSHFNVSTPANAALFGLMGIGIVMQTIASVFVAVALWRQMFVDRAMGWALRLGMTITICGALIGGIMTQPTSAQIQEARSTHRMTVSGAHSVGGPDGGPGVPGTGWSTEHGDLRVSHFLGLHAIQALALIVLIIRRGRFSPERGVRIVKAAAASYVALVTLFLWQALRGESAIHPGALMQAAGLAWAVLTAMLLWMMSARRVPSGNASVARGVEP
jgi:hypothetical protein